MSADDKIILTPDEAISLLADDEYVHNFKQGSFVMLGCDYGREGAIEALREALQIEIGGPACKAMKHPLAVWATKNDVSFFEADMEKVEAMELAKSASAPDSIPERMVL